MILATSLTPGQKIKLRVADLYDRQADEFEARNMFALASMLRAKAEAKRAEVTA